MEISRPSDTAPRDAVSIIQSIHANWHLPASTPSLGLLPPLCPPNDRYFPEAWPSSLLISLLHLSELTVGQQDKAISYLESLFSARAKGHPEMEKLGVQVVDVEAAVADFNKVARRKTTDGRNLGNKSKDKQGEGGARIGDKRKPGEESHTQDGNIRESSEKGGGSRKRISVGLADGQDLRLDKERTSSLQSMQEITRWGHSLAAPGMTAESVAYHPQQAASPTSFVSVPPSSLRQTISFTPQLSQQNSPNSEQFSNDISAIEQEGNPKNADGIAKTKPIMIEVEAAYQQQEAGQEQEIIGAVPRRQSALYSQSQSVNAEAFTHQQPSSELARVKNVRLELEAARITNTEERMKMGDRAYKKLVLDVQAACRPQSAPPPAHQVTPSASQHSSHRQQASPQQRHSPASPTISPLLHNDAYIPLTTQLGARAQYPAAIPHTHPAYAQQMAARQHANALLPSQPHVPPLTPMHARHAGPYTPISPRQYAHPERARNSPTPPVRTSQHHLPMTPMSPQQYARSPPPQHHSIQHRTHYPQQYPPSVPPTPRYPPNTPQQHEPSPHTPRRQSPYEAAPAARESAEVMLCKLELEEAEARLRASIQQERLRAEVAAKKKAVARAMMMMEKGVRQGMQRP